MSAYLLYDVLREGLRISFIISLPILATGLIVGLVIGLFQALTSIQEMTLTFVPKVGAFVVVFWVTMNFMSETMVSYFQTTIIPTVIEL